MVLNVCYYIWMIKNFQQTDPKMEAMIHSGAIKDFIAYSTHPNKNSKEMIELAFNSFDMLKAAMKKIKENTKNA